MTAARENAAYALSVVVPVYNGARTVGALVVALSDLAIPGGHEIILVDDGSADDSRAVCEALARAEARVPVTFVRLARNFGEHNAVMAGLSLARGALIITMDDDLQNPPAEVVRLFERARDGGHDVTYTYYAEKRHNVFRNLGSAFANRTASLLLGLPPGLYLSSFRCVSAFVAREVCRYTGPFPFVDGLILQVTRSIGRLQVEHLPRAEGRSNYTLRRLVRLWLNIALNFSTLPLRLSALLGLGTAAAGTILGVALLSRWILLDAPVGTGAGLLVALLLLSGIMLVMVGVVGEYVGRTFQTVSGRPQYAIHTLVRGRTAQPGAGSPDPGQTG
ncbi:glycosyltransferase family 2 protein [Nitrospirillum iridis]|uniref:Undecaprenyl-phosphate 4-deoxy-4-formamido-L-arabinose transferase n=1 Tax=Nitrospirillum iridis TaxID=765888 RepID=A0A7X0EEZ6_9PROT|nr:undecaprenyl-phosphate 4-deoxy-4-formamido-L-arabinose transferase [Nitrospirillum iridis]